MMSGPQVNQSNTCSRLSHPNHTSLAPQTTGWTQCSGLNNFKGLRTRIPSSSEFSTCSNHSEPSFNPSSPRLPRGKICMGRPYNSKCVETSHLVRDHKVVRKSTCHRSNPHCLLCTDGPRGPSSPTFLDQLIKGISYLDRSTNAFSNPKTLNLPRLAVNYLERAANSLYLDHLEHSPTHSYYSPSASMAPPDHPSTSTCMVPSTRDASALQCLAGSTSMNRQPQPPSLNPMLPLRSGIKLPELPLFGNGFFSLGRLPKFWEAIRSGWSGEPEPMSKPPTWW